MSEDLQMKKISYLLWAVQLRGSWFNLFAILSLSYSHSSCVAQTLETKRQEKKGRDDEIAAADSILH